MRPVQRGDAPEAGTPSEPVVFSEYREAAPFLVDRMGAYCSYCERRIETHLAVDHVQPKSINDDLLLEWTNFLLACVHCNSHKGNMQISLGLFYWPDRDNTLRAFLYEQTGCVSPLPSLAPEQQKLAARTLDLVGLDRIPGSPKEPSRSDYRWARRREAYGAAVEALKDYRKLKRSERAARLVATAAVGFGFWSVWMTVFSDEPRVRRLLLDRFPGTDPTSFDDHFLPVARPGGLI